MVAISADQYLFLFGARDEPDRAVLFGDPAFGPQCLERLLGQALVEAALAEPVVMANPEPVEVTRDSGHHRLDPEVGEEVCIRGHTLALCLVGDLGHIVAAVAALRW